jgi:chemotaxis protein methyltransferase CheR
MHLILCRNVLIYFDKKLQGNVLNLLKDSLVPRGFMILGDKETLNFTAVEDAFETFAKKERIYRKNNDL